MHRRLAKVAQRISREEERSSRSAKLKRQEACAKILHATAGTEAKGGRQPLSARDMDMGMGTRRMLACNGCNCPICLPMASSHPHIARSELPHQIFFGTAVSRMRLDDLGCAG